jgi:hypothetical protein
VSVDPHETESVLAFARLIELEEQALEDLTTLAAELMELLREGDRQAKRDLDVLGPAVSFEARE